MYRSPLLCQARSSIPPPPPPRLFLLLLSTQQGKECATCRQQTNLFSSFPTSLWDIGGMIQSGDGIRPSWRNKALSRRLARERRQDLSVSPFSLVTPPLSPLFLHAWLTRNEREHKARKSPRNSSGNYPSHPPLPCISRAQRVALLGPRERQISIPPGAIPETRGEILENWKKILSAMRRGCR